MIGQVRRPNHEAAHGQRHDPQQDQEGEHVHDRREPAHGREVQESVLSRGQTLQEIQRRDREGDEAPEDEGVGPTGGEPPPHLALSQDLREEDPDTPP